MKSQPELQFQQHICDELLRRCKGDTLKYTALEQDETWEDHRMVTRRSFVGGALAFGAVGGGRGATALPGDGRACSPLPAAMAEDGTTSGRDAGAASPHLSFGVVSDIHIGGKPDAAQQLEKVLRWFASERVDAVLCPGDIAHSGNIRELEAFAEVWHKVFQGKKEEVELMISTGNHDIDAWGGRWKNFTEEQMLAQRFNYKNNLERTWRRLFNQKWELIWRRKVKGYTFIGAQWSSLKPPIEAYMREIAADATRRVPSDKPFFYCQHAHPRGTCHVGTSCVDGGESVRALTPFANAVAISGHSHFSISDERTVWQGAFTSIGAGCLHEGFAGFDYDNVTAFWHPSYRKKFMCSLADPQAHGGDAKGGGCEIVEVYDDHLVVRRQSVAFMRPIGPAWTVPMPARRDGPLDFSARAARRKADGAVPQFAAGAKIAARFCPNGHALEGVGHSGEPCIYVTFPRAQTVKGGRVFDYTVEAVAGGMSAPAVRRIAAAGFAYPEEDADIPGEALFSSAEIPHDRPIRITVTPRDCFGLAGKPLVGICRIGA